MPLFGSSAPALLASAMTAALALGIGCGGDDAANGAGSGGSGGAGSASGGAFSVGSGGNGIDACAQARIVGDPIPVTMLIMFDKSGSMLMDQKWAGSKAALIAFFQDEDSAGLEVALRFFPDDEPIAGCNETSCSVSACAAPLVEKGVLNDQPGFADPQQQALVDAVNSRSPAGQTPMYAALAGAEQWAVANLTPERRTVVVLVTDGEPNSSCAEDGSFATIVQLAADAHAQSGILTYAVGMSGSDTAALHQLAQAGGTDQAFVVTVDNISQGLLDALKSIRKAPIACTLDMPEPASVGQDVDPEQVNVSYTPGGSTEGSFIPQVASAGDCGNGEGWYYDDPNDPTTITLCDASCATVQADLDAVLEVVLGCKTVVK